MPAIISTERVQEEDAENLCYVEELATVLRNHRRVVEENLEKRFGKSDFVVPPMDRCSATGNSKKYLSLLIDGYGKACVGPGEPRAFDIALLKERHTLEL